MADIVFFSQLGVTGTSTRKEFSETHAYFSVLSAIHTHTTRNKEKVNSFAKTIVSFLRVPSGIETSLLQCCGKQASIAYYGICYDGGLRVDYVSLAQITVDLEQARKNQQEIQPLGLYLHLCLLVSVTCMFQKHKTSTNQL